MEKDVSQDLFSQPDSNEETELDLENSQLVEYSEPDEYITLEVDSNLETQPPSCYEVFSHEIESKQSTSEINIESERSDEFTALTFASQRQ